MVRTLLAALFLLALGCAQRGWTAEPPALPCGDAAFLLASSVGAPPAVAAWSGNDLGSNWQPPACTGWPAGAPRWAIAVSGQFRGPATTDEILARVGGISRLKSIRYWSVTGKHWKDLLSSAHAVIAVNGQPRADFSAVEIRSGQGFYFVLNDSTAYRGSIAEATSDRVALSIENVTTLKFMLMPLFHPGGIKFFGIIQRQPDGAWSYHSLVRIDAGATSMGPGDGSSYVNRAVAYYRYIAGIPTDQEPPAVR